jgi:hypothetical protein
MPGDSTANIAAKSLDVATMQPEERDGFTAVFGTPRVILHLQLTVRMFEQRRLD